MSNLSQSSIQITAPSSGPAAGALALLVKRLQVHSQLTDDDVRAINRLPVHMRRVSRGEYIVRNGNRCDVCCIVADGHLFRAKDAIKGRQILSFHIVGDIPDLQMTFLGVADHDLVAATDSVLGFVPHTAIYSIIKDQPNVGRALLRVSLIDAAIFREWIVNVGQRKAPARLGHILTETSSGREL